jgi:hypothetical protein
VCTDTLVHYEHVVWERVVRPGSRMRRVCTGTLAHYEPTVASPRLGMMRAGRTYS